MSEAGNQDSEHHSYVKAGVNIDASNALIERIAPYIRKTFRSGVMSDVGGFGALFELPLNRYKKPVLVSGTDGVGTKLKLATALQQHDTIGIDLVAMCTNDILVSGAEPLFFLDYYATGRLDSDIASEVVKGIAMGCELAGAALIGGETAEMPGIYAVGDYDLAGFCVGIVEKHRIIEPRLVQVGDSLLALASSGPHSNGYSLIRRILDVNSADLGQPFADTTLGMALLTPTRIYVKSLQALLVEIDVHALAHITGGGMLENLPRVLPRGTKAVIDLKSWHRPALFNWLQEKGNVVEPEMLRTFNCGVGMVVCVSDKDADRALDLLTNEGENAWRLGSIESHNGDPMVEFCN